MLSLLVYFLQEERIVEPKKDEVTEKAVQIVITPATVNDNNSDEEEEKKEEEDKHEDHDDYYDDYDNEFSFAKFAAMHFQHSATHTYIQQRLKSPLLYHEDEGEALVRGTLLLLLLFHCHVLSIHYSFDLSSFPPLRRRV